MALAGHRWILTAILFTSKIMFYEECYIPKMKFHAPIAIIISWFSNMSKVTQNRESGIRAVK